MPEKALLFLSLGVKFLCSQQYFSTGAIYRAAATKRGNGQMSINKGLHLVVKRRYEMLMKRTNAAKGNRWKGSRCVCV